MKLQKPLIKVCGMRDSQNIADVANLHPDMMGFIFFSASKRYVGKDFILPKILDDIQKVGVFVNESPEEVIEILSEFRFQTAQLHGNESPEDCMLVRKAGFKVMKAFGIDETFNCDNLSSYIGVTDGFVFDTKTVLHGGSGEKFNWDILSSYKFDHPFLLSGGIKPEDTESLEDFYHPHCIGFDINSGFETSPANKDVKKLEEFIKWVRG